MIFDSANLSSRAIETRVRDLVNRERTLTFTALAAALHDCRWISLFWALHHLERQRVIRLIPLPWDYQICTATRTTSAQARDQQPLDGRHAVRRFSPG